MHEQWFTAHPSDEESAKQRLDRNFNELLQELRVAQTGVQILLGFLLTMVFASRFSVVQDEELWLYATAVLLATLSMGLLMAPVPIHRLLFRRGFKPHLVRLTHVLMSAGLLALMLAVSCAVTLALTVALSPRLGVVLGAVVAVALLFLWYGVPVLIRIRDVSEEIDL